MSEPFGNLSRGQRIRIKSFTDEVALNDGGNMSLTYKANKNEVYVAVLLGVEPRNLKDKTELDIIKVLMDMGWTPPKELRPKPAKKKKKTK